MRETRVYAVLLGKSKTVEMLTTGDSCYIVGSGQLPMPENVSRKVAAEFLRVHRSYENTILRLR